MPKDIDARIDRLLDQLDNRHLSAADVQRIQEKVAFLESLRK